MSSFRFESLFSSRLLCKRIELASETDCDKWSNAFSSHFNGTWFFLNVVAVLSNSRQLWSHSLLSWRLIYRTGNLVKYIGQLPWLQIRCSVEAEQTRMQVCLLLKFSTHNYLLAWHLQTGLSYLIKSRACLMIKWSKANLRISSWAWLFLRLWKFNRTVSLFHSTEEIATTFLRASAASYCSTVLSVFQFFWLFGHVVKRLPS